MSRAPVNQAPACGRPAEPGVTPRANVGVVTALAVRAASVSASSSGGRWPVRNTVQAVAAGLTQRRHVDGAAFGRPHGEEGQPDQGGCGDTTREKGPGRPDPAGQRPRSRPGRRGVDASAGTTADLDATPPLSIADVEIFSYGDTGPQHSVVSSRPTPTSRRHVGPRPSFTPWSEERYRRPVDRPPSSSLIDAMLIGRSSISTVLVLGSVPGPAVRVLQAWPGWAEPRPFDRCTVTSARSAFTSTVRQLPHRFEGHVRTVDQADPK